MKAILFPKHLKLKNNLGKVCQGFLFLLFSIPTLVFASGFSFSTEPQSIPIGEISGPITIHSESDVLETTYILLSSDSSTGQFWSSKTSSEPVQAGSYIYISTGNANRTFYYKDTSSGNFVITANIFAKDKVVQLASITQNISVGSNSQNQNNSSTTTETSNQSQNTNTTSGTTSNTSAHSSFAPISNTENKIDFEISAGRDRLSSVGNKIFFVAKATKTQNLDEKNISYEWSFGDGTLARGSTVDHTYLFAGEYSVVLNGYYSDKQAVSRIKVLVVEPKFSLNRVSGGLEIFNNSEAEINLENWKLIGQYKTFVFPKDTLLAKNKKIVFADDITGININSIILENPIGKKYAEISINLPDDKSEQIEKIAQGIEKIKLAMKEIDRGDTVNNFQISEQKQFDNQTTTNKSLNFATVFEAQKEEGLVNKIFHWPIVGLEFVSSWFK